MAKDADKSGKEKKVDEFADLPPAKKLPKEIQDTLDNEEKLWAALYDGSDTDSTETSVRYAAYASRLRTIMLSAHRYVAYTSDIGESFRPVAHPILVRSAYAVSWAYLAGDVGYEGYKAYIRNQKVKHPEQYLEPVEESDKQVALRDTSKGILSGFTGGQSAVAQGRVAAIDDYRTVMAQRALFQGIASMGLPAFTIHSIVRYSGRAMKNMKNQTIRTWGPIGLGLAAVPFLPYMFDKPVEHAVEWTFHKGFEMVGGPQALHSEPPKIPQGFQLTGKGHVSKEKEL